MVVGEELIDIPASMRQGEEFENAKIIVIDIGPPTGNIDIGTGQQTLRRRDHGDHHIGQYEDR